MYVILMTPELSIVIPIYNETESIPTLKTRLLASLKALNRSFEIIYVNDGSKDNSIDLLKQAYDENPDVVRIIDFHGNFGQHMAIMAGFEHARGNIIINLDADLQNPPEDIHRLLEQYDAGHDYVGSYRRHRQDHFLRTYLSKIMNWFRDSITDIRMRDQGCMLRVYSRRIVDLIIESRERSTFIPALAYKFALNPTEIDVTHDARLLGESKYTPYMLVRVTFDLITSFSTVPLQLFTMVGIGCSLLTFLLVIYMFVRRFLVGSEVEGVFTLFAILFFLMSILMTGVGLLGEYIGRISETLSNRPRFVVKKLYCKEPQWFDENIEIQK
jgi:undecaprenyl-phosphate 4-deoxy-4-formamido-L-arabinose transferase